MKKILVIQFRTNPETLASEADSYTKSIGSRCELVFKNALTDNLDWSNPVSILEDACGLILGGSGEFDFDGGRSHNDEKRVASHQVTSDMAPFLEYIKQRDFPTLGICFGHQLIGTSEGVCVSNDKKQAKVGSHFVVLSEEGQRDILFTGVPLSFTAQYGHKDSLSELPKDARLLAYGASCTYSALRFGKNRYTLQFHPELEAEDLVAKLNAHPDYLPPEQKIEDLVRPSPDASKILRNFVELVVR